MTDRKHIAVGVDSEGRMWTGHFGLAPAFDIYDRSGGLVEHRINPYRAGGEKKSHHTPGPIAELLPECGVFLARAMGDESKRKLLENLGVEPVITTSDDPAAALHEYLDPSEGSPA